MPSNSSHKKLTALTVRLFLILLFVIWSNAFTAIKHLRQILTPAELIAESWE